MFLKLQPEQISAMWDAIKYTALEANQVAPDRVEAFTQHLLTQLLSGRAQVWVLFEDKDGKEYSILWWSLLLCGMRYLGVNIYLSIPSMLIQV